MCVGTQDEPESGVFYAGCTLDCSYCDVALGHLRMKSLGDPFLKHYYAGKTKKKGHYNWHTAHGTVSRLTILLYPAWMFSLGGTRVLIGLPFVIIYHSVSVIRKLETGTSQIGCKYNNISIRNYP